MRTFLAPSVFSFLLLLRFLLTRGNVSSCDSVTYAPWLRHIFGYIKLALWQHERNPFGAQISLFLLPCFCVLCTRISSEPSLTDRDRLSAFMRLDATI